jgi:hypothetical protein
MALKLPNFGPPHTRVALAPGFHNPAIVRCCDAWNKTYRARKASKKSTVISLLAANEAYRKAMPPLSGTQNISDFIACVNHGMILTAICDLQAKPLLAAAKAALAASRLPAAAQKAAEQEEKHQKNKKSDCPAGQLETEPLESKTTYTPEEPPETTRKTPQINPDSPPTAPKTYQNAPE